MDRVQSCPPTPPRFRRRRHARQPPLRRRWPGLCSCPLTGMVTVSDGADATGQSYLNADARAGANVGERQGELHHRPGGPAAHRLRRADRWPRPLAGAAWRAGPSRSPTPSVRRQPVRHAERHRGLPALQRPADLPGRAGDAGLGRRGQHQVRAGSGIGSEGEAPIPTTPRSCSATIPRARAARPPSPTIRAAPPRPARRGDVWININAGTNSLPSMGNLWRPGAAPRDRPRHRPGPPRRLQRRRRRRPDHLRERGRVL